MCLAIQEQGESKQALIKKNKERNAINKSHLEERTGKEKMVEEKKIQLILELPVIRPPFELRADTNVFGTGVDAVSAAAV